MHTLHKYSVPDWEKQFETIEELRVELEKWICTSCHPSRERYNMIISDLERENEPDELEYYRDLTVNPDTYENGSELDKLSELFSTACGCEFGLDEATLQMLHESWEK